MSSICESNNDIMILMFYIMHIGWESDNIGYVFEREDGTRYARTTNHGDNVYMGLDDLAHHLDETKKVLEGLTLATEYLTKRTIDD